MPLFHCDHPYANTGIQIHFMDEPASQRAPAEVWQRIALHIPRYHLRTWLFVSAFHREIAMKQIFHTVDLYFGEDNERGLDLLDRAKADPWFASLVKSLRLHWAIEESDMLDLMIRASPFLHIVNPFFVNFVCRHVPDGSHCIHLPQRL